MSVQQAGTDIRALRELEEFPLVEALFGRRSRPSREAGKSRTARWPTGPGMSRFRSANWSGCWSSAPWAGRRNGISRSPGTPATRRTSRTIRPRPPGARSRRRPASIPPNCSSPTTRACTCSRPATPARSSTRPPRHVRQGPGDGAVGVHHELRPGSSPGPRLLRPVLQTRRIPAHARRAHAALWHGEQQER